jgi:hypothetical protein
MVASGKNLEYDTSSPLVVEESETRGRHTALPPDYKLSCAYIFMYLPSLCIDL